MDHIGSTSMLEDLYRVEHRVDQPRKKVKTVKDDNEEEDMKKSSSSYAHRSGGIIGEYMKPASDPPDSKPPFIAQTVDLTAGELV
jgi:hypothetical protein